jgi:nitrite reductase/ring-hydroxylating ferredoxin subunit
MPDDLRDSACRRCGLAISRREFVQDAASLAAAVAALAGRPEDAHARPPIRPPAAQPAGTATYPLPPSDGVAIDRENQVILARHRGAIYAFALSCPHQRTMLTWLGREGRFQCPKHKSKYQPDGTFISGRATRNMDRHPIVRNEGGLVVDLDTTVKSDEALIAWSRAAVRL